MTIPKTHIISLLLAVSMLSACHNPVVAPDPRGGADAPNASDIIHLPQAPGARCALMNVPDSKCTPGDVFSNVTTKDICRPGYSKGVRDVPDSEKEQVFSEYGVTSHAPGQYEVDHLISLELGGSNEMTNLWPEAANPKPGFHQKDSVENWLHDQVCAGRMSLPQAQHSISTNWLGLYHALSAQR